MRIIMTGFLFPSGSISRDQILLNPAVCPWRVTGLRDELLISNMDISQLIRGQTVKCLSVTIQLSQEEVWLTETVFTHNVLINTNTHTPPTNTFLETTNFMCGTVFKQRYKVDRKIKYKTEAETKSKSQSCFYSCKKEQINNTQLPTMHRVSSEVGPLSRSFIPNKVANHLLSTIVIRAPGGGLFSLWSHPVLSPLSSLLSPTTCDLQH